RKYQAKAKMSEAKLQLSSVYTAETAFFSDYNIYHNCLSYMGYNPHREVNNRYYAVGFKNTAAINADAYTVAATAGLSTIATDCPNNNASTAMTDVANPAVNVNGNVTWYVAGKGVGSTRA